jgi:hypothetical protein
MKTRCTVAVGSLAVAVPIGAAGCIGTSKRDQYTAGGAAVGGIVGNEVGKNK